MRAAVITFALAIATVAQAAPSDELEAGKAAFRTGQYQKALPILNNLLYPELKLARQEDLTDAYVALGVCRFETGDIGGAKREFEAALTLDPNSRIDPLIVTDPTAIQAFNETKLDLKKRTDEDAERKRKADLAKIRASLIGFEQHQFLLNFAPFGFGQFQNKDNAKGVFFAATEGAAFVASASIWFYLVNKYGIRSTHVPRDEVDNVHFQQQLEIGTGVLFFGLWVIGAIDAYRHYEPQTRATIDDDLLPPELRDPGKKKRPKPKPTSILDHLSPMVTPHGAGIGLSWEN